MPVKSGANPSAVVAIWFNVRLPVELGSKTHIADFSLRQCCVLGLKYPWSHSNAPQDKQVGPSDCDVLKSYFGGGKAPTGRNYEHTLAEMSPSLSDIADLQSNNYAAPYLVCLSLNIMNWSNSVCAYRQHCTAQKLSAVTDSHPCGNFSGIV